MVETDKYQPVSLPDAFRSDFLELLYATSLVNRFPIAIWRLPNERKHNAVVDLSGGSSLPRVAFEELPAGFIFAPFNVSYDRPGRLIKADLYCRGSRCLVRDANSNRSAYGSNRDRFEETFKGLSENSNGTGASEYGLRWFVGNSAPKPVHESEEAFRRSVEKAIKRIKTTSLQKVVLSRTIEMQLREGFDPLSLFLKLCQIYTNAFTSLVALPGIGTWIGATPELLLRVEKNELTTVALAGTQPVSSEAAWHEKEVVEQAMVSDHIRQCFIGQNVTEFEERGPDTMRIGNLLHLRTEFSLKFEPGNLLTFASGFLNRLHPTPAVCGVPNAMALAVIEELETHRRDFYSGYLGPVNLTDRSDLFVNLRCLRLLSNSAVLYAGSGITADSEPKQESVETDLKLEALGSILNNAASPKSTGHFRSRGKRVVEEALTDEAV